MAPVTSNNSYAVPRNSVPAPNTTAQNRAPQQYAPTAPPPPSGSYGLGSAGTQRPGSYDPYASTYAGSSSASAASGDPNVDQISQVLQIIMAPTAAQAAKLKEDGIQIPRFGASDLQDLLLSGAQIPSTGTLEYETEKGTIVKLTSVQLRSLQQALLSGKDKEIEVKDSKGDKFKLKFDVQVDKKTGQITKAELKESVKRGFFGTLFKPILHPKEFARDVGNALKSAGGWLKNNWKTVLMAVGTAALIIGTAGAGAAFAPAMMSIAAGANTAMGVATVAEGVYNGVTGKGWNWGAMALGAAGAFAGGAGLLAKGSNIARVAGNVNTATRVGVGTQQAIRSRSWLQAAGLAANGLGWYASEFNTPLSGSVNQLNQISRGVNVAMTVDAARQGNIGAMMNLGQNIAQNGFRNTFDPRVQPNPVSRGSPNYARNDVAPPNLDLNPRGGTQLDSSGGLRSNDLILANGAMNG